MRLLIESSPMPVMTRIHMRAVIDTTPKMTPFRILATPSIFIDILNPQAHTYINPCQHIRTRTDTVPLYTRISVLVISNLSPTQCGMIAARLRTAILISVSGLTANSGDEGVLPYLPEYMSGVIYYLWLGPVSIRSIVAK